MNLTLISARTAAGCCLALLTLAAAAQERGFYFDGSVGPAFAEDVSLKSFIVRTPGRKLDLDTGGRLTVAGGYNFCEYFGAQLESGFIFNEVDGLSGDAALSHVPILADAVFRYDKPDCKWVPYAGVGAGGDFSVIALDHVRFPGGVVDGSEAFFVFAWQVFAGARYKLNDKMSIGGGYKFYTADGADWNVDGAAGDIETGTARIHSVSVDFNMKF